MHSVHLEELGARTVAAPAAPAAAAAAAESDVPEPLNQHVNALPPRGVELGCRAMLYGSARYSCGVAVGRRKDRAGCSREAGGADAHSCDVLHVSIQHVTRETKNPTQNTGASFET